ncbi:MAG TPA: PadR family transcriptional regulator [Gemmatimonadaceae bacterium]
MRFDGRRRIVPIGTKGERPLAASIDILRGTLDVLVLKALSWGPSHGYDVATWIERATGDVLSVGEGTLYPALHRLRSKGWVRSSWGVSDNGRRACYYELTATGRAQLRVEKANWTRYATAVFAALAAPAKPA